MLLFVFAKYVTINEWVMRVRPFWRKGQSLGVSARSVVLEITRGINA